MYKGRTITGTALVVEATERPPFGPGFTEKQARDADTMEIWHTNANDPGRDFNLFKLLKEGRVVHQKQVDGH